MSAQCPYILLSKTPFEELSKRPPDHDDNHKRGIVWFTQHKPVTLRPGGVIRVTSVSKFQGVPGTQAILVDTPEKPRFLEELLVRPELQASTVVMSKRIIVLFRNASTKELILTRGMSNVSFSELT